MRARSVRRQWWIALVALVGCSAEGPLATVPASSSGVPMTSTTITSAPSSSAATVASTTIAPSSTVVSVASTTITSAPGAATTGTRACEQPAAPVTARDGFARLTFRRRCERRPGAYVVDVEYPALEIDDNPGAAARMNDVMTARLDRQVLDLQSFMTTNRAAPAPAEGHLLTVTFEVHSFFAEVISLHTSLGWYGGGAVNDLIHVTFAFDPRTGDEVPFAALFAPSPGRGAQIEDAVESELRRSGVAVWSGGTRMDARLDDGLDFDVPDNYAAYALTRAGIVVYLRRYQVGPGATGSPAVTIPYATWADLIAPDSLAAHAMFS